jgi:polyhydroxybutyrate depolymerase
MAITKWRFGMLLRVPERRESPTTSAMVDVSLVGHSRVAFATGWELAVAIAISGVDDVAFIRSLVGHLVRTGVSDPHRVYVTGFSTGGMMTLRLMCEAPELIAAVALIGANFPIELAESCEVRRPTPILVMNGTVDPVVPYAGGAVVFGGGQVLSTYETISFMRTVNRCADRVNYSELPDIDPDDGSHVIVASWTKCASAAPVVLYRIEGGGHRIPSRREDWPVADILLGRMNNDFEAAYAMWNFFKDKKCATGTIATSAGAPHG